MKIKNGKFQKLRYNQLFKYFDSLPFTSQCAFRKGFSSQYCQLVMLEKFKEVIDRGSRFEARLTNLSKTFDCIDLKHLIEKLYGYDLSSYVLNIISSTWNIEHSKPKLMTDLVPDRILNTVFHKAQFFIH